MKTWLARLMILLLALADPANAASLPPLLEPGELAARLDDGRLRVVDIREGEQPEYVPGAAAAPYANWRGPADSPGRLPEPGTDAVDDALHDRAVLGLQP